MLARASLSVREVLREKGTPFHDLGLGDPALLTTHAARRDRRPSHSDQPAAGVTPKGVRLCRPSEKVLDLLPPQRGRIRQGRRRERVIDEHGRRVATA